MFRNTAPLSALQSLAAKWRVLGMLLVAVARQVSLAHKQDAQGGVQKAEMLEASTYSALIQLSADIAAASADGTPQPSKADELALSHMKAIYVALSIMALLISQLKRDLVELGERLAKLAGAVGILQFNLPREFMREVPALDSS